MTRRDVAILVADDRLTRWKSEFKVPKVFHSFSIARNISIYVLFIIFELLNVERLKQYNFAMAVSGCTFAMLPF